MSRLMQNETVERLARRIAEGLNVVPGEHVLLAGGVQHFELLARVAVLVAAAGGRQRLSISSDDYNLGMAMDIPAEYIDRLPDAHDRYMAGLYEAAVHIPSIEDPVRFRDIPPERLKLGQDAGMILNDISKAARRRSIYMGWPAAFSARDCGMDLDAFETLFLEAFFAPTDVMEAPARHIAARYRQGGQGRIRSARGSDLSFRIAPQRRVMIDSGRFDMEMVKSGDITKNLPCGEVYTTVVEESVEGRAVFDLVFVESRPVRELVLEFREGCLVEAQAAEGIDLFRKRYDLAIGQKDRIGELGIGLNPALTRPLGHTLLDEKIRGSVHLALGENRMYGGVNVSSLHWDLVMLEPTLTVDGDVLLDAGQFPPEALLQTPLGAC